MAGGALTGGVQSVHVCAYLFGFCAIAIPVATGAAGTATTGHYGIHVTVINQKWTLGQAIATGLTSGGLPLPNVTITGSFDLATGATGHGFLSLVAATTIVVSAPSFNVRSRTATPSRLHLRFVPEPSSTWLLGAAVLGITSVARKRRLAPGRMESRSAPDSCGV
jgi:hypothetical protein